MGTTPTSSTPSMDSEITVKWYTADWCEVCQDPTFKLHVENLQKKWIYGDYKWQILFSKDRQTAEGKYPRIEFCRDTRVLQVLTGAQEIRDTLEMALENYLD